MTEIARNVKNLLSKSGFYWLEQM